MDIVNKHEVHEKSYRKLAAEYGVSGKWLIFENLKFFSKFFRNFLFNDGHMTHFYVTLYQFILYGIYIMI